MRVNNRVTYRFDHEGNRLEQSPIEGSKETMLRQMNDEVPTSQSIEEKELTVENSDAVLYGLDTEQLEQLIRGDIDSVSDSSDERQHYEKDVSDQIEEGEHESFSIRSAGDKKNSEKNVYSEDTLIDIEEENSVTWRESESSSTTNDEMDYPTYNHLKGRSRSGRAGARAASPSWGNVFIVVCSALATGVVIGYMILTLMFGQKLWPFQQLLATGSNAEQQLQAGKASVVTTKEAKESNASSLVAVSPMEYSYHLLQHGVFNQENTRDEAISLLKQKGYPSAYIAGKDNKYYLYTGIATSAAHATPVSEHLFSIETYRKEVKVVFPQQLEYNGSSSELEQYIADTNLMMAMFADISSVQFEQTSFSPLGSVTQQAWEDQFKQWADQSTLSFAGFKGTQSEANIVAMNEHLKNAKQHLSAYQSKPSAKEMWQVQQAALQAVLAQKEWIDLLNTLS